MNIEHSEGAWEVQGLTRNLSWAPKRPTRKKTLGKSSALMPVLNVASRFRRDKEVPLRELETSIS